MIIVPLCGSILQAETCQILSLAENPGWSPSVAISSRMIVFSKGEGTSKVSGIIDPDCTVDLFWKNSTLFYHFFSKLIIFHLDLE